MKSLPTPEAGLVALTCEHCRGSFDFRVLEAIAVCPYCHHQQALPAELLGQAERYAASADAEQDRAQLQALIAARYDALRPSTWLGMALWGAFTLASAGGIAGAFLGTAGGLSIGGVLALLGLVGVLSTSAALTTARNRKDAAREAATSFATSCPGCGGSNVLSIGQTLASCSYCGAALVPGERLAAIGLGLAEARTRAFKLNAVAASRQFRVSADRRNRLLRTFLTIVSPVLPAVLTIYSYQQYRLGLVEWSQVMVAAIGTILILAGPVVIHAFRSYRDRPMVGALNTLVARPGSTWLAGVEGTICWLNGLWPDEYGDYYDLQPGSSYRGLATNWQGFPVLVTTSPGSYLHIAVGASVETAKVSHATLKRFGFQVKTCQSGAMATLRGQALRGFGDPRQDQRLLACIAALVDALRAHGARPAARS